MTLAFALTWDYRCPFARNAHEHLVTALRAGAPWEVKYLPFWLTQMHLGEGEADAWDNPDKTDSLLAMLAGIVVRDRQPERFMDAHIALFAARHDQGADTRDHAVIAEALDSAGVDMASVMDEIHSGWPLATAREEHTEAAERHSVWGVPTFILGDQAAFVRYMDRPGGDADLAQRTIQRTLDLLSTWPELNEFKHTSLPR